VGSNGNGVVQRNWFSRRALGCARGLWSLDVYSTAIGAVEKLE